MNDEISSEEIDLMIVELKAAGWVPKSTVFWRAPGGSLHLGPAGAWRTMKRAQNDQRLAERLTTPAAR